ncbi:unnamed protein product [Mycetohabitans rhizoxinica HKI 454]|uniref:Uncharacterized protein n=1 Tax=Mycetohabitans rhizoxinica (strain DSM 19002 / CIP 109453 / HKI 454) TaxID=882378 RepID=E5AR46_MYCRK|nr:unnamed protein product [Mycetohabitans rhizoxinica HKI 454]
MSVCWPPGAYCVHYQNHPLSGFLLLKHGHARKRLTVCIISRIFAD